MVAADFDGDGDVDIASANQYDNSLSVRFNNGSGSFSGSATLQVTSGPVYIKAVDVDGDGDLDLASANIGDLANYTPDNDSVSIRINDGSGNFSGSTNIGIDDRVTSVEPADIDNDGDMDLLATGFGSLRVFPLINNGSGSFTLGTPVYAGDGPMVAVADFDGDGDVDFATANGSTNTVAVRFNNGSGSFTGSDSIAVSLNPVAIFTGDFDGDGDIDIATGNNFGSSISILLNGGSGNFGAATDVTVPDIGPSYISGGDFDGDGDVDIVIVRGAGGDAIVYLNAAGGGGGNTAPVVALAFRDTTFTQDFAKTFYDKLSTHFTDPENDVLTITATALSAGVTVTKSNDSLYLTGNSGFSGDVLIRVVADDAALSIADTFKVTVTGGGGGGNTAPFVFFPFSDISYSVNFPKTFYDYASGYFFDGELDPLTITASALSAGVSVEISNDSLYLTGDQDFEGDVEIRVQAFDGSLSVADTFLVSVVGGVANHAPEVIFALRDTSFAKNFGRTFYADLLMHIGDPDFDMLTYTATALSAGVTAEVSNDSLYLTGASEFTGNVNIRVVADDGEFSVADTFKVTVTSSNLAPTLVTAFRDTVYVKNFGKTFYSKLSTKFSDPNNDPLTITATALSAGVTVTKSNDSLYLTGASEFTGNVNIRVVAGDGEFSVADTFNVTVTSSNLSPSLASVFRDTTYFKNFSKTFYSTLASHFTDANSDPLTITATALSAGVTVTKSNDSLYLTGDADFVGTVNIKVLASDGSLSISDTFQVNVNMIVAWGSNGNGQTTIPAGLTGVTAIAGGGSHSLALKSDGTVVGWGSNGIGQTTIPAGLTGVIAIAAGNDHSLALKSDGTVVEWGNTGAGGGQITIPAGLTGVIVIAAGGSHSLALKSDGTVVGWGRDIEDQATIPAGLTGVIAIAAGVYHSLALKSDGTVVGWGENIDGQTTIPAGLTGVIAIAAGGYHSLALKSDGTVVGWGYNSDGQTTIPAGLTGVTAIAAGGYYRNDGFYSLALKSDGTVVGWGYNAYGQTTIPAGLTGVTAIAAGSLHSLALIGDEAPANLAPVLSSTFSDTAYFKNFNKTFYSTLASHFTDADGDPLTITATALSSGVTVTKSNDSLYLTGDLNFTGNVNIRVLASDRSLSVADTFQVSVIPPLTIASLSPTRNDIDVPANTNIALTFSEAVSASTADTSVIKVYGSQTGLRTITGRGSFSGGGTNTVTFDPAANFKPGEIVSVISTSDAQTPDGKLLQTPSVHTFTTEAAVAPARFSGTINVSVGTNPSQVYAADFDGDGDIDIAVGNISSNNVSIRLNDGTGNFSGTSNMAVETNPISVYPADFDGDGDMDIASANYNSDNVSIRLNDGVGNFSGTTNVAVGDAPSSIQGVDLDGDGDMDIITANFISDNVSIRLNDGAGNFNGTTNVAVGDGPSSIQAVDFDGDGDMDIATANFNSHDVSIRLNDGNGNFSGMTNVDIAANAYSVYATDFDGDGDMDIATANRGSTTVSIILNDGAGNFSGMTDVAVGTNAYYVYAADFDGDGDMDIAAANRGSGNVSIRLNDGAGNFSGTTNVDVGSEPLSVYAGDFDGDGDMDIATANYSSNTVSIRFNQSSAPVLSSAFSDTTYNRDFSKTFYSKLASHFTDTDGDALTITATALSAGVTTTISGDSLYLTGATNFIGDVDIRISASDGFSAAEDTFRVHVILPLTLTASTPTRNALNVQRNTNIDLTFSREVNSLTLDSGAIKVYGSQTGLRTFTGRGTFSGGGTSSITFDPATDFKPGEIVTVAATTKLKSQVGQFISKPSLYSFTAKAATAPATFLLSEPIAVGKEPRSVTMADLNGDSDIDMAVVNNSSSSVSILLNNGLGQFTLLTNIKTGGYILHLAACDLDADGDQDLAVLDLFGSIYILLNDGQANFTKSATVSVGGNSPNSIIAADLDGDGDIDLATANYGDQNVSIRWNDGKANFTSTPEINIGSVARIEAADVDGDGDLDIVGGDVIANKVKILLNNGGGNFAAPTSVSVGKNPEYLSVGDLDGDGDLDIVTSNISDTTASIILNNGNGNFTVSKTIAVVARPQGTAVADLDGDGDLDLIVGTNSSFIVIGINNGNTNFSTQTVKTGSNPNYVATADLDGDGDLDIATANKFSNTASILFNQPPDRNFGSATTSVIRTPGSIAAFNISVITTKDQVQNPDVTVVESDKDSTIVNTLKIGSSSRDFIGYYTMKIASGKPQSQTLTIKTKLFTLNADTTYIRTYGYTPFKAGYAATLETPDKMGKVSLDASAFVSEDIIFASTDEIDPVIREFSSSNPMKASAMVELHYDQVRYDGQEKQLFVYRKTEDGWTRLDSRVDTRNNTVRAQTDALGQFKVSVDPTFTGDNVIPQSFALRQNYPNPFNPTTTIAFDLPQDGHMKLEIFNLLGQKVKTLTQGFRMAGSYRVRWDATNDAGNAVSSGVYLYRLATDRNTTTKKMMFIK